MAARSVQLDVDAAGELLPMYGISEFIDGDLERYKVCGAPKLRVALGN